MPIAELRVTNFRAFADTGLLRIGPLTAFVGKNDVGKSAILHALSLFFDPPTKKAPTPLTDFHKLDSNQNPTVELAFDPTRLRSTVVQIDARNQSDLIPDFLVDAKGLLRLRLTLGKTGVDKLEVFIRDVDFGGMFPLGLKDQNELLDLLNAHNLPAVPAGRQTNQQKRSDLRNHAIGQGAAFLERWVDATAHDKAFRTILPQFAFFQDTARFAVGETPVQNQFKAVVDKALKGNPQAQQIETAIANTIQAEFDKVYAKISRLTDNVTTLTAQPNVSWKKAVDQIGLSWTDQAGLDLPFELRGAGIRRLFMVAYFQYLATESIHDPNGAQYVFVVEEPELHLHPGAQRSLLDAFEDLAGLGHSVLLTTHSPVFAATAPVDSITLVRRVGPVSTAHQKPAFNVSDLAEELGVEASDRLLGPNHVILVEGKDDESFYEAVLRHCFATGAVALNPDDVCFMQTGGISNLKYAVTAAKLDQVNLKWCVISDSDRLVVGGAPSNQVTALLASKPASCLTVQVLDRSAIENYLDPVRVRAVTGIDCLIPPYGKPTTLAGVPLTKPDLKLIKRNAGAIAVAMGADIMTFSNTPAGASEWISVFNAVKSAFGL